MGAMASMFGMRMPRIPDMPAPLKPATVTDPAVQQATAEAAARRKNARGYRSTILSQTMLAPDAPALKQTLGS
jgi:hypothetical protein